MKVLIVGKATHLINEIANDQHRFSRMVSALQNGGIEAYYFSTRTVNDFQGLLDQYKPDLVFSAAYSIRDELDHPHIIHRLLEQRQIAYVGSDAATLSLALSKVELKDHWQSAGILTPKYHVVRKTPDGLIQGLNEALSDHNFPYILKPSKEGNSRGISQNSIVDNAYALQEAVLERLAIYDEILVEKYLGTDKNLREFTVAMIGNQYHRLLLPCEIVLKKNNGYRVITTADKDEGGTQAFSVDDPALHEKLIALAEAAFDAAGVNDYARLDVLHSRGKLYAIEINGQPMIPDRWFEACARGAGLDTDQYLNAIFLAGMVRNMQNGHATLQISGKMVEILPGDIFREINYVEKEVNCGSPT
jgi:D-alanine-D-alanine ligase-like ATP-grasp enzyme